MPFLIHSTRLPRALPEISIQQKIRGAGLNLSDESLIYNHIPIFSESG